MRAADIHGQYENLRETLLFLSNSPRNQLHQIGSWLDLCRGAESPATFRSYVRDLLSILFAQAPLFDPLGSPPSFAGAFHERIAWVERTFPEIFPPEEFRSCATAFARGAWKIHACLGRPEAGESASIAEAFAARIDPGSTARERLEQWIRFSAERQLPGGARAEEWGAEWDRLTRTETGTANVPFVEEDHSGGAIQDFQPFVTFTRLRVLIRDLPSDAIGDAFDFSRLPGGETGDIRLQLETAAGAVRRIAPVLIRAHDNRPAGIILSLADSRGRFTGRSLGLGFGVAFLSLLSSRSRDRKYYAGRGSALFTGMLDAEGSLLPIAEEQIRIKTRAALYSPFACLVLPKANEAAAETALAAAGFPGRSLDILPLRHLRDAADHRKAVAVRRLTFRQRAVKLFRRHQGLIAAVSAAYALLLLAASFLLVDFDRTPAEIRIENNYYHVLNRNGKLLWRQLYGTEEHRVDIRPSAAPGDIHNPRNCSAICDIDGDGSPEVLLLRAPLYIANVTDRLSCYSADGTLRWSLRLGRGIQTQEGDYRDDPFSVEQLRIVRLDSAGRPFILCLAKNVYYANFLLLVSPEGSIRGEYLHLGSIHDFRLFRSGSGAARILFSGTNNSLHRAVAGMLDPGRMNGVSRGEGKYALLSPGIPRAREIRYLLFPRSDLSKAMDNIENPAADLSTVADSSIVAVAEEAVMPQDYHKSIMATATLNYILDPGLVPVAVNTSSFFDVLHRRLVREGKIRSRIDDIYKKRLLREFRFIEGDRWIDPAATNRRSLEPAAPRVDTIPKKFVVF